MMNLSKELFEDVIVYQISEIGAMGPNGTLTCLKKNGEYFTLNYLSEETPWETIKKNFLGIDGCRFDGPMKKERIFTNLIVIGGDGNGTQINQGWKHIWLDFGNHLVCKEECFSELKRIFDGSDNCEITFEWEKLLDKAGFIKKLSQIETAYKKQKEWDEKLMQKLSELNKLPEYKERISNANRENGIDGMLAILKEYGVDIDFMELKRYGFRQQGII